MKALDIDAVRSFLLTAEMKSFTRAAEAMNTTQSAISLKLQRLEKQLGRRLLERTPRQVRLSADGSAFLAPARELVSTHDRASQAFDATPRRLAVGISHQLVGSALPKLLRTLRDSDPQMQIEMHVSGTGNVMQAYAQGELDAALVLRPDDRRKQGKAVFSEPFSWFAALDWIHDPARPLQLATQGPSCRVRNAALRTLDRAGIAWDEVFIGKGAAIVGAAATSGLGIALLARRTAPPGTLDVGDRLSLPPIPAQDVMLYSSLNDRRSRNAMRLLTLAFQQAR